MAAYDKLLLAIMRKSPSIGSGLTKAASRAISGGRVSKVAAKALTRIAAASLEPIDVLGAKGLTKSGFIKDFGQIVPISGLPMLINPPRTNAQRLSAILDISRNAEYLGVRSELVRKDFVYFLRQRRDVDRALRDLRSHYGQEAYVRKADDESLRYMEASGAGPSLPEGVSPEGLLKDRYADRLLSGTNRGDIERELIGLTNPGARRELRSVVEPPGRGYTEPVETQDFPEEF